MEYQEPQHTIDVIFRGSSSYESRCHLKAMEREVNLTESPITVKPSKWLGDYNLFQQRGLLHPFDSTR